ncbi:DUF6261 family protein [Chryseobacterium sp. LC2016-27]|uniref:DUF6261 family protein n=1 Tax=Chryseobacterium sp. LC2016-27 TaxID=2897326 RepID=UPI001E31A24F|nr:DUF6261 family protein [Chryseobacterium sp. LC2016-27]MCD0456015.1 DUF6261 family protein [Chryseobacterium sp. LC2016-27]
MNTIKLNSLYMNGLQNAEFGQLIVRFFEDLNTKSLDINVDPDLKRLYEALQDQLPAYNTALDQIRASEESEQIFKLDKVRDRDIQALRDSLKPYRNAKTQTETDAYNAIRLLISEYKGVEDDSYESETNRLNSLIGRLQSPEFYNSALTLGIEKFIMNLAASNTDFNQLFAQRSFKISQKVVADVKALRKTLASDYKTMINYIAAMASVKEDTYYKDILTIINNGRNYFSNVVLSRRMGNKDAKKSE